MQWFAVVVVVVVLIDVFCVCLLLFVVIVGGRGGGGASRSGGDVGNGVYVWLSLICCLAFCFGNRCCWCGSCFIAVCYGFCVLCVIVAGAGVVVFEGFDGFWLNRPIDIKYIGFWKFLRVNVAIFDILEPRRYRL